MMSQQQRFGAKWELWVLEQLKELGHDARLVSNFYADVDIMLGSLPIEVKASRPKTHYTPRKRTRWQFDVSRLPTSTDSVVIMVAVTQQNVPWAFVCPSWACFGRFNVHITSYPLHYRGQFAKYLNAWWVVEQVQTVQASYAGQLPLKIMGTHSSKNAGNFTAPNPHFGMGTGDNLSKSPNGDTGMSRQAIQNTLSPFPIGETL